MIKTLVHSTEGGEFSIEEMTEGDMPVFIQRAVDKRSYVFYNKMQKVMKS